MGDNEVHQTDLYRTTSRLGPMNKQQRSLAWQCYREALSVRVNLYRFGSTNQSVSSLTRSERQNNSACTHSISRHFRPAGLPRTVVITCETNPVAPHVYHECCLPFNMVDNGVFVVLIVKLKEWLQQKLAKGYRQTLDTLANGSSNFSCITWNVGENSRSIFISRTF